MKSTAIRRQCGDLRRQLGVGLTACALVSILTIVVWADEERKGEAPRHAAQAMASRFRNAEKTIRPCIVAIESFGGVNAGGGGGKRSKGISKPGEGPTTGVIVSAEGHIITSTFNFLRQPPIITVVLDDGRRCVAKMLGRDDTRKLCLLKINVEDRLPVPNLVDEDALRVGQWAISLGVGYGNREPALAAGIISALNRMGGRAVQTDANISPANYGGPLVDLRGRLIGICVPLHPNTNDEASGAQWYDSGIGFAVPLAGSEAWLDQLKAGKNVDPAFLGVAVKPGGEKQGVVVAKVEEESPAATAKLEKGDRILELDGEPIFDAMDFTNRVKRRVAGEEVTITLLRGEERLQLTVALAAPPRPKVSTPAVAPLPSFELPRLPKLP
jgi:serine protease Do